MRVRLRRRRLAVFLPALVISGFLLVTAGTASGLEAFQKPRPRAGGAKVDVVELRQQAIAARKQLQQATEVYQQSKQRLEEAREELDSTKQELEETRRRLEEMEEPVGAVANAAYQHSPVNGFGNIFMSRHPKAKMRAAVDFANLTRQQQADLREISELVTRKQRLVQSAGNLAKRAQARSQQLEQQKKQLQKESAAQTRKLMQGLRSIGLDVSRGERLPLGCDPASTDFSGYPNGLIPKSALCPLPQNGEYLRADAAVAFARLNVAYARHFGKPLCVTDSYRSLAQQQDLYYRKPSLAAVPGTSNHGLALAVDLCGGINSFGTEQFVWMKKHAGKYGWVHPDWAAAWGSRPEPWHWEYNEADP